jgi:hypothetical protein
MTSITAKTAIESVAEGSTSAISTAIAEVTSSAPMNTAALSVEPIFTQTMPASGIEGFMKRATKVGTLALASGDTPGAIVMTLDPWDEFLSDPVIASKTENYAYIRGSIQVIGVVTCPGGAYGLYAATALCRGGDINPDFIDQANVFQTDHYAKIDCSAATNFAFQLPFVWPYDFAGLNGVSKPPEKMWEIFITCLQPLGTGVPGGVTLGHITFYANLMDDYVMTVPYLQGKSSNHNKRKMVANHALANLAPEIHNMIGEGKGSKMAGQVAQVAESLSKLPVIGAAAGAVGLAARGAETAMSWFGFTRDHLTPTPQVFQTRSVTNVALTDGEDISDKAALTCENAISIDPRLAGLGGVDTLSFEDLTRRWTVVKTIAWSTTDVPGTILSVVPVTPFYSDRNDENQLVLTPAGYIGLPFAYWRADMEYRIMVPVSKFHRGVLQVAWIPSGSSITTDPTNYSMNTIYDVTSEEDLTVQVGYAKAEPFLPRRLMGDTMAIIPYGAGNGTLVIRVVNSLVSQAVANTRIFVLARARNLDVQCVNQEIPWIEGISTVRKDFYSEIILQGGALGDDEDAGEHAVSLVPFAGELPSDQLYFGERIQSVRALMQKPTRLLTSNLGVAKWPQLQLTPMTILSPYGMTFAGYYSSMFTGIAASERFKFFPNTSGAGNYFIGMNRLPNLDKSTLADDPKLVPTMAPVTYTGPQKGAEFILPYYTPLKYVTPRLGTSAVDGGSLTPDGYSRMFVAPKPQAFNEFYYSFGPDIRGTCFKQVPLIGFRSDAWAVPWQNQSLIG